MERLPHDRSSLLWNGHILDGSPTSLFIESMDGWIDAMLFDEQGGGSGSKGIIKANIIVKEDGVICGKPIINRLIERHFSKCAISWNIDEGEDVKSGQIIVTITGESIEILRIERIMLNILGNLSGIATNTNNWTKKSSNIKLAATRKTDWGLLDKWAIHVGGGLTHRLNRNDALMMKENDFISLKFHNESNSETIKRVMSNIIITQEEFVIVEVQNLIDAIIVVDVWKNILNKSNKIVLLLDNVGPKIAKNISLSLSSKNLRDYCILEGSGNIDMNSLEEWSESEIELISSSGLNRGVRPLDLSMIFEEDTNV